MFLKTFSGFGTRFNGRACRDIIGQMDREIIERGGKMSRTLLPNFLTVILQGWIACSSKVIFNLENI